MKFTIVAIVLAVASARSIREDILAKTKLWTPSAKAVEMSGRGVDIERAMKSLEKLPTLTYSAEKRAAAPASFDPREKWPHCETMHDIRDQGNCGSCWAFGSVSAISDRICVSSGKNVRISSQDALTCSGAGSCNGGDPAEVYSYWLSNGLVSEECQPYTIKGCAHFQPGASDLCPSPSEYEATPACSQTCVNGRDYVSDRHRAAKTYKLTDIEDMKVELSTNGPCTNLFFVYSDFAYYKGGIFEHVSGDYIYGHAVKVIGYGSVNGTDYWLAANSWREDWGEKGYFRIKMGDSGFDRFFYCGVAADV